jgi:hypothetical protein
MNSATNTNDDTTKRLRIDPSALLTGTTAMNKTPNRKTPDNTKASADPSPTAAAARHVDTYVESLYPQLTSILPRISKTHLQLLQRKHRKEVEIESLNNTITTAMDAASNSTEPAPIAWPRSANLRFHLSVPKNTTENPEYIALAKETATYVQEVKINLTKRIHAASEISLKVIHQEINSSLAKSLFGITLAYLKSNNHSTLETTLIADAHAIVNSILEIDADNLLKYSHGTTINDFRTGYQATYNLNNLPTPENFTIAMSPARRRSTVDTSDREDSIGHALMGTIEPPPSPPNPRTLSRTTRTKRQSLILTIKNICTALLIQPFEIFITQKESNDCAVALKKLETELFTTPATDAATMLIDN